MTNLSYTRGGGLKGWVWVWVFCRGGMYGMVCMVVVMFWGCVGVLLYRFIDGYWTEGRMTGKGMGRKRADAVGAFED